MTAGMSEEKEHEDELADEELEQAHGEPLPDREAMSILRPPTDTLNPLPAMQPGPPPEE
jgi:hypothetical protein